MTKQEPDNNFRFCVPCLFGLEGLCADELKRLNFTDVRAENGRVFFSGSIYDAARANINLRTGDRVLLNVGETNASDFDELFEGVQSLSWENYIPVNGAFPVKGYSRSSKLHSESACQKTIKKAVAERLQKAYKCKLLSETAAVYQIQFAIVDDTATLYLDTTGTGLRKRGYRPVGNVAPLRETLAAAIVKLSRYKGRETVIDPFCGSGTIPIEAALAALNRAPGISRNFAAESWAWIDAGVWNNAREDAKSREYRGEYDIRGSDIDPRCTQISEENAKRAGVSEYIRFETIDALKLDYSSSDGILMTNPPYGERIMSPEEAQELYTNFGAAVKTSGNLKMYILSSHTEFERTFGKKAVKKRKLYNGMIKCDLFMYF